jgi:serine/threonine protein kinase
MVERFRQEVQAAARLSHPNIVRAYDAENAGKHHFLVMEYIPGVNLDELLYTEGPFAIAVACNYARQTALGLQHAHEHGMVHRDIKPHNLMRAPEGKIKILDFGLAHYASEAITIGDHAKPVYPGPEVGWAEAAARGNAARGPSQYPWGGTIDYMAPEAMMDPSRADIRADIYSLGCTLYRFLTGEVPFARQTPLAKLRSHLRRSPKPVGQIRRETPPELARIVERMMAKDPRERFQTPAEAARALASFADPQSRHILIIEDEWDVREALAISLEADGFVVARADNGRDALDQLEHGLRPDVIVLDLQMPVMDGWEFMRQLKEQPALTGIPVMIVSATDVTRAKAATVGAVECLQKPVDLQELTAKVESRARTG